MSALAANYDWLQFYGDVRRSGNNTLESRISASNVGGLKQIFRATLPATGDGAPAILTAAQTATGGVRDLAFVTTKAGHLVALDAHTGATVWSAQPAVASQITSSSAAVDPSRAFVYSYGVDGYVHKFNVSNGSEVKTGGFPELVTLKPTIEKGSSAIATATANGVNYLYMATSAFIGDGGTYQGHLTTVNLNTGAQNVFNAACSNRAVHFVNGGSGDCSIIQSALWARVGIVYNSDSNRILAGTGNGTFNPATFTWGDSLLALNPDGTGNGQGQPLDSYTPTNYQTLQNADLDLGSTAPALLLNSGSKYPHIALQSGKDAMLRIINLDNMSGQGGPGHVAGELFSMALPQGGQVQNAVPTWVNPADNSTWAFVASPSNGLAAFKLLIDGSGNPSLQTMWQFKTGGGSPLIANNVLYYSTTNKVYALSPTTGAQLWSDGTIGKIHWESPVVANGVLYVLDESAQLTAYSLDPSPALSRTGWVASASLSANGSPPANAIDGDLTTRWTTGVVQAAGQWFQLDLGSSQTFNEIGVLAGGNGDYAAGWQLETSNDGQTWSSPIVSGAATNQSWSILFPTTTARYLRIVLTAGSSSWFSIDDINVYDSP
ncbi:MAG TPA: discoidin domain-containing protein, partial [Polyangia bacterium]|nr:discoidin domain-containing protein [Polyangia bacterium]